MARQIKRSSAATDAGFAIRRFVEEVVSHASPESLSDRESLALSDTQGTTVLSQGYIPPEPCMGHQSDYQKIEAFLLCWDSDLDDLTVDDEVQRFKVFLKDKFSYNVDVEIQLQRRRREDQE